MTTTDFATTPPPTVHSQRTRDGRSMLPRASVADTLRILSTVLMPIIQRGVIVRRPSQVRLMEAIDADSTAVSTLQRMREKYGRGPLRLRIPGRRMVVVLSPEHVHRVLENSPEPFHPATREKRAALAHFEPEGVLVSSTEDRPHRRAYNEAALDTDHDVHRGAEGMLAAINGEVDALIAQMDRTGTLDWDTYAERWMRMVRRVVFGDAAADDEQLTDDMLALRQAANWAFLSPTQRERRDRLHARIQYHLDRAEPGSLAGWAASAPTEPGTHPEQQVPQWLFAFDAASWASFRALALLASHPARAAELRRELDGRDLRQPLDLPFARACFLESLRLWPTTPAVLRETTRRTSWPGGSMPEDTSVFIYAPLFHRDDENVEAAHRFEPEHWERERTADDWPFIPFSAGPAICPARNLVLHITSTVMARVFSERSLELESRVLNPAAPLPGTLSPFDLRFRVSPLVTSTTPIDPDMGTAEDGPV
jgi:cytochrome P450